LRQWCRITSSYRVAARVKPGVSLDEMVAQMEALPFATVSKIETSVSLQLAFSASTTQHDQLLISLTSFAAGGGRAGAGAESIMPLRFEVRSECVRVMDVLRKDESWFEQLPLVFSEGVLGISGPEKPSEISSADAVAQWRRIKAAEDGSIGRGRQASAWG